MKFLFMAESIALCFFLCRYLEALSRAILRTDNKKRLKTQMRAPKIKPETPEEAKKRILLQNIENYGTDKPQEDI